MRRKPIKKEDSQPIKEQVQSRSKAKLWLLLLKLQLGLRGRLSRNILREVCSYFPVLPSMAFLSENGSRLYVLSLTTMKLQEFSGDLMPNSLCLVNLSTAFYLEGTSLCNSPQLFNLETESLLSVPLMQEARFCPGVAFLSPHLYVFAGATDACERLSLITRQWSAIAAFPYAVTGMSTCTRLDNIYLAASYPYSLQVFYTLL